MKEKELHNTALLLTACLRRGRRCRPLAARTAAAECHVRRTRLKPLRSVGSGFLLKRSPLEMNLGRLVE